LYRTLERRLTQRVLECMQRRYPEATLPNVVVEQPPKVGLGDFAIPIFPFAKPLRSAPLKIAETIRAEIGAIEGIAEMQVAPPGYLNVRIDRAWLARALTADKKPRADAAQGKILVEHSSINPNKAAHIGHLRNAILGDTFVRLLRFAGREVDVQNYIDNTGVQVADVVVGLVYLNKRSTLSDVQTVFARECGTMEQYSQSEPATGDAVEFLLDSDPNEDEVKSEDLPPNPIPPDYFLWELYARVSRWYEYPGKEEERKRFRRDVLHAVEEGRNEMAAIAEFVSTTVLRRHLETMERLDIEYDFLPRESEILHLHFWDAAFTKLKESGVLVFESEGKNKGCWVMRRAGTGRAETAKIAENGAKKTNGSGDGEDDDLLHIIEPLDGVDLRPQISEEDQKVIVRSNGTVGYVGKDIAYHMWKFGLLGRDFGYRKFYKYPNQHDCWISSTEGEKDHPHFGDVEEIYNVIDARQAEAQSTVIEALRGLGHNEAADHYTHFSYEMVALTPRCAAELGYTLSDEDKIRSYIEVSGRKGFGVKADDLLDQLIASAKKEVDSRHPQISDAERLLIAKQIAIGALRYFMLKYTKQSVIAFDFKDALSFEGETGPYAQYAVVRATSIFRKAGIEPETFSADIAGKISPNELAKYLTDADADEIWELWLASSKTSYVIDQCIATTEPAYLAKHVFQLAQLFNTFYHRHPILSEADEKRKQFLLATVAVVRRELIRALAVMGITVPPVM
jgi:arginyl-tRNA synthetase